jgi:hypothetical protein
MIIFSPIAERESIFYLKIAKQIKKENIDIDIQFISFYQPMNNEILNAGFEVFDIYSDFSNKQEFCVSDYEENFNIINMHKLILHEQVTFSENDTQKLCQKFCLYLNSLDGYLSSLNLKYNKIVIYQELGGFVAPLSLFFAAQKNNITHYFFEPSFFKGRIHLVKNSLFPVNLEKYSNEQLDEVDVYINSTIREKIVAIPEKDRHHFQDMSMRKIINNKNIGNIFYKLYYKYIKKQKQEYSHIFNHVTRYLNMWINRKRLEKYYSKFDTTDHNYVYFPFHVQLDYSLTIRSTEYLNQLSLVEYVSQTLPSGYFLYIKEHPASIGGFKYRSVRDIMKKCNNIKFIHPAENSHNIVQNADAVLTINSKVGAESIVSGKEVIALGSSFYQYSRSIWKVDSLQQVEGILYQILKNNKKRNTHNNSVFYKVWRASYQIELYNNSTINIINTAKYLTRM